MRLIFENGGRTGMRDEDALINGFGLWGENFGSLFVEDDHGDRHLLLALDELRQMPKTDESARAVWLAAKQLLCALATNQNSKA